jgi:hypothetical protein
MSRSALGRQLEEVPIDLREAAQESSDLEVVAGHGADLGDEVLAHVFGDGLLVDLGGEVIAALGGVFMEGALEQIQRGLGLAFELFLAKEEPVAGG